MMSMTIVMLMMNFQPFSLKITGHFRPICSPGRRGLQSLDPVCSIQSQTVHMWSHGGSTLFSHTLFIAYRAEWFMTAWGFFSLEFTLQKRTAPSRTHWLTGCLLEFWDHVNQQGVSE